MLKNKRILLGITGSIAAYKSALLVRLLVKQGAEVKVVMTDAAKDFITPLTLATLSKNPVFSDFSNPATGEWNNHVELGTWADLFLIAPASANTIGKMANGICDNLLLACYLSARCPVFIAPAMDLDMFQHPAVQQNLENLSGFGHQIIEPGTGELASGLVGQGRMAEPEEMLARLTSALTTKESFAGKKVLITAGPTYEAIDPVRFIGNHSSGKMGYALAEEFAAQGAQVFLVSGPTSLKTVHANIERIDVQSAEELYDACIQRFKQCDIAVLAAAVADYKPKSISRQKIKKSNDAPVLDLVPTKDTLAELGKIKKKNQLLIGFALETNNELEHAKLKLKRKNLDLIVLNSMRDKGAGFGSENNKVTILDKYNKTTKFELKSKPEVARDILDQLIKYKNKRA